jgi:hypothetical protein
MFRSISPKEVLVLLLRRFFLAILVIPMFTLVPLARAETLNCSSVDSLPFTISKPGIYCLTKNLSFKSLSVDAITITASSVLLDLDGYTIRNTAGSGTIASGISAGQTYGQTNITVRNGTLQGFFAGIRFLGGPPSGGHLVEQLLVVDTYAYAIQMSGQGNIIRNNRILRIGGTTTSPGVDIDAISVFSGSGAHVLDNDVTQIVAEAPGSSSAIRIQGSTDALVVNNRITEADRGIFFDWSSSGKYRDNLTFDVGTPFSGGGTDAGNNS